MDQAVWIGSGFAKKIVPLYGIFLQAIAAKTA
jgi:hypothetical protein